MGNIGNHKAPTQDASCTPDLLSPGPSRLWLAPQCILQGLCELAPATSLALGIPSCSRVQFVSEPGAVYTPIYSKPLSILTLSLFSPCSCIYPSSIHPPSAIHPSSTPLSAIHSPVHHPPFLPSFLTHPSTHPSVHLIIHPVYSSTIHPSIISSSIQFIHPPFIHPSVHSIIHPVSLSILHPFYSSSNHIHLQTPPPQPSTHPFMKIKSDRPGPGLEPRSPNPEPCPLQDASYSNSSRRPHPVTGIGSDPCQLAEGPLSPHEGSWRQPNA